MESDFESDLGPIGSRKLRPSGGSVVVTIPPAARFQAGVQETDDLQISVPEEGTIVLRQTSDE